MEGLSLRGGGCVGDEKEGKLVVRRNADKKIAERRRLGWGPGEKKQGPRIRNQAPGGRSRCRLRARPLGLKELPELKTICTAPFLIWLPEQPTLHSDSLSMLNRSAIHKEG